MIFQRSSTVKKAVAVRNYLERNKNPSDSDRAEFTGWLYFIRPSLYSLLIGNESSTASALVA
jgi:hypothetical protein